VTASNTFHKPASAAAAAASASASPAGGVEQELHEKPEEQLPLPPGVNEDGEIEDMNAWDEWQSSPVVLRDMHRREEVNINHSHRRDEQDDIEIGGNF
ncbi:conjugal transfer protein TraD, partial [Klebsiella aerogenes]